MNIPKHTVQYTFSMALLSMACVLPVYAVVLTTLPSQYIEKKLPVQKPTDTVESQVEASASGAVQEEQQSILRHNRITLNVENTEIQNMLDYMVQNPNDLAVLQKLENIPEELLHKNFTGKLYETESVQDQRVLIQLLPVISGEKALPLLLSWVEQFQHNRFIVQAVITALYNLPDSDKSRSFINQLLDNELQDKQIIKRALFYHAARPGKMSRRWANQYRSPGAKTELRYAGLYLAAVLGDKSVLNWVIEELDKKPSQYKRYYLHLALSLLVDEKKYQHFAQRYTLTPASAESIQRQLFFKQVNNGQRIAMLREMLASGYFEEKQLALNYLIETKNEAFLSSLLQSQFAVEVYRKAKYAGLEIKSGKDQAVMNESVMSTGKLVGYTKIILLILVSLMLMTIVWYLIKRQKFDAKPLKLEEKA